MACSMLVIHVPKILQLRGQLRTDNKNQVRNGDLQDELPPKKAKTKVIYGMKKVFIIL